MGIHDDFNGILMDSHGILMDSEAACSLRLRWWESWLDLPAAT